MKTLSKSKYWLLAGSLSFLACACQNQNYPPPSMDQDRAPCGPTNPEREREWQNREQDRLNRRMEERRMIEDTGGQPSRAPGGGCNPCDRLKRCSIPTTSGEALSEENAQEAPQVASEPVLEQENPVAEAVQPPAATEAPAPVVEASTSEVKSEVSSSETVQK